MNTVAYRAITNMRQFEAQLPLGSKMTETDQIYCFYMNLKQFLQKGQFMKEAQRAGHNAIGIYVLYRWVHENGHKYTEDVLNRMTEKICKEMI